MASVTGDLLRQATSLSFRGLQELRPSVRFATIRVRSTWRGLRDTGLVLAGWPLSTTCMGYCGALSVGLVFALPLLRGGGERFFSLVLLSRFLRAGVQLRRGRRGARC